MRALLLAGLLALSTLPASAYDCEDVRRFVATHTAEQIAWAKKQMTREQVREALRCLREGR